MAPSIAELVRGLRDRREAVLPALLLLLLAGGVYVFLQIADEMAEGELHRFDDFLFLALRNPADTSDPLGPPWLEEAAVEITALGGYPIIGLALIAVVGLLLVTRRFGPALYVVMAVGSGTLVSQLLKGYYERPRPDLVEHLVPVHTASFPSGHAFVGTVAYLTLAALVMRFFDDRRVRGYVAGVAVFVSVIVGASRVYLGVHWPSDVAAGWALGIAWACLAWLSVSALRHWRRRQREE